MGRRIVTRRLQTNQGSAQVDTYFDKVIKYIPADIVAAWTFVQGLVASAGDDTPKATILWMAYGFGLVVTALWTHRQTREREMPVAKTQIAISTLAFGVWVLALGGPFEYWGSYSPLYGSLLLVAYTLVVGLIVPPEK